MLLVLWGFTPDRASTVVSGFEGLITGMIDLVSRGLQLQVAPGFVWFPLIVMSSLCSWFIWLRNSSQFREALLLHGFLPQFFCVSELVTLRQPVI